MKWEDLNIGDIFLYIELEDNNICVGKVLNIRLNYIEYNDIYDRGEFVYNLEDDDGFFGGSGKLIMSYSTEVYELKRIFKENEYSVDLLKKDYPEYFL